MDTSTVSVVIPCYNRAKLIGDAIESALAEPEVIEVVVIDDGSTDETWSTLTSYGDRIAAHYSRNRGPALARNLGASLSCGNWIKFLDSDDKLVPGAVAAQLGQLKCLPKKSIPVGQLCSGLPTAIKDIATGRLMSDLELGSQSIQVSQPLVPRQGFDAIGGFRDSTAHEDYELMVRLALDGWRFYAFDRPVTLFRDVVSNRLSSCLGIRRFEETLEVFERIHAELLLRDEIVNVELRKGIGLCAWSMGRRAARHKHFIVARDLFAKAMAIAGTAAFKGSLPLRLLYRVADPVAVECMLEKLKSRLYQRIV